MPLTHETRAAAVTAAALTIATAAVCFLLSPAAGLAALLGCGGINAILFLTLAHNRNELSRLCDYLAEIRRGNYQLDIRDNREGELSILKNEIYKMALRLSEQAELLKRDKKYLADSMADISHQLKTPLTSLIMLTDLLAADQRPGGDAREKLPPEKRAEFTAIVHSQLSRIEWLVSSLLKLSKIDAGAVVFRRDSLSPAALLRRAAEPLLVPIELKRQTLIWELDEASHITGDESWLTEALLNILKNCTEHTPEGGTLRVSLLENPLYARIVIEDNGTGISARDLPHIFERFYRGENSAPESVGIGLAMARSILLNQDADISVQSEPGRGSRFIIKFYKQIV